MPFALAKDSLGFLTTVKSDVRSAIPSARRATVSVCCIQYSSVPVMVGVDFSTVTSNVST